MQCYNGAHYEVVDAFRDMSLSDSEALEKALEKYKTFRGWDKYKNGWRNRLNNLINFYRHGNYNKLY